METHVMPAEIPDEVVQQEIAGLSADLRGRLEAILAALTIDSDHAFSYANLGPVRIDERENTPTTTADPLATAMEPYVYAAGYARDLGACLSCGTLAEVLAFRTPDTTDAAHMARLSCGAPGRGAANRAAPRRR